MPENKAAPLNTFVNHLFNSGGTDWVSREGAKSLTSDTFVDFLHFESDKMTQDQRATTAAHILDANPSVLNNESIDPALNLMDATQNNTLFKALKKYGSHLDHTLRESKTLKDYSDTVFLDSVPH